jgi:hypothetical protein
MNIKLLGKTFNVGKRKEVTTSTSYTVNPYYQHQDYANFTMEPGQIIYVDNPSDFIVPDGGDNSEEYW